MLKQAEGEFGDIFETIVCEARFKDQSQSKAKKNYRIEVTVHYIAPKMKIKYEGSSDVLSVYGNKVALCELSPNKHGEYQLDLAVDQV